MTVAQAVNREDLLGAIRRHIGRFSGKRPDWDAFPANRGYPQLSRAQIRYVGAGGSPKVSDPLTMKAEHFTLSLVHLPAGNYAASHVHDVEEAFFVVQGVLTVASDYDGRIVKSRLAPRDMLLNEPGRPHGFLNEGVEPVLMAIMVANFKDRPVAIRYKYHPKDVGNELAERFGGEEDSNRQDVDRWITRFSQTRVERAPDGIAKRAYIGEGAAPVGRFRKDLVHVPVGAGVHPHTREVEEVYLVTSGYLNVGWEDNGVRVEECLGPRDALFTPAGRTHFYRNDGVEPVEFLLIAGNESARATP